MRMPMRMLGAVRVGMFVDVLMREQHVEFHAGDVGFLSAGDADVPSVELEFFQFLLQCPGIDAKIEHGAEEHVAADAAENVEVQCLHNFSCARCSLVWRYMVYISYMVT